MKSFQNIIEEINQKKYAPVYLLDGEEPYYIDRLLEAIEDIIPEDEKDFNLITFYGKEASWQEVINAARQFPMFGERILVIVREAANMEGLGELSSYIQSPQPSTILVIEHRLKKVDGRSKLPKIVTKEGVYFTSSKLKESMIPDWIVQYCASRNSHIEMKEAQTLAAYLGEDLQKITNELEKIWINKDEGNDITAEKIEKYIGINRNYNIIELPSVLFENNQTRLANMLNYFSANPNVAPMPLLIGVFYSYLQKIYLAQQIPQNFTADKKHGIWSFHRKVAGRYAPTQIHQAIAVLEEYSHKAIGIGINNKENLLLEMTGKMQAIFRHG